MATKKPSRPTSSTIGNSKTRKINPPRTDRTVVRGTGVLKPFPPATKELLKAEPRLAGRAFREPEIPLDDVTAEYPPFKGAVPIPDSLRGEAPEEARKAAERDEVAAEFERLIRKEYPDKRAPEYIALKQFWALYRAHYLKCGHRRLARLCLHYFA